MAYPVDQIDTSRIKRAVISAASSGANTVVACPAGQQVRVIGYSFICTSAVTVTWKSGTTAITGPMDYAANGGLVEPPDMTGILQTAVGEDLNMTLGGAVQVSGRINYQLLGATSTY